MTKIPFRWRTEIYFLKPEDILWIQADGNYTKLILVDSSFRRCQTNLKVLTDRLKLFNFFRSHKSWLVNLNHVHKVELENQDMIFNCSDEIQPSPLLSHSACRRLSRISEVNSEIYRIK